MKLVNFAIMILRRPALRKIFFPVVYFKRFFIASMDAFLKPRLSYSQYGEDLDILQFVENIGDDDLYIDVGANQPSYISNTYLFYRSGYRGILIEPTQINAHFLKLFRPKDVVIRALAGASPDIVEFRHCVFSTMNSVAEVPEEMVVKKEIIPQISLDMLKPLIGGKNIFLISIDTEGYDLEVLKGAVSILEKVKSICVEYHGDDEKGAIVEFTSDFGFSVAKDNGLNLILVRSFQACR